MSEIISKLISDLRWRLSKAGRDFKPRKKEKISWGAFSIPGIVPFLILLSYMLISLFGFNPFGDAISDGAYSFLLGFPAWVVLGVLLFYGTKALNTGFLIKAYQNLLETNERFALVEYHKYLNRQLERAKKNPALGGPAELKRLKDAQDSLSRLLNEGAGRDKEPVGSQLSEEAEFAESIVESFELQSDPLAELDSQLTPEVRKRVEELERQIGDL